MEPAIQPKANSIIPAEMNTEKTALCATDAIPDPGSKGFEVKLGRKTEGIFIVHKDGQFFAYRNACPHTGANLEWQEDRFLDLDNNLIQCATHDALFTIDGGECIAGPCAGDFLEPVKLRIADGQIYLDA